MQVQLVAEMAKLRSSQEKFEIKVTRTRDANTGDLLPPVERTLEQLGNCNDLRKQLKVKFEGEGGVDAGGLTVELFHGLCIGLMGSTLFTKHDKQEPDLRFVLPVASPDERQRQQLVVVGRLLVKMLYNGLHASALSALPTFFFKYIWGRVFGDREVGEVAVTTRDYEEFVGWKVSRNRQACLLMTAEQLDLYCLTFVDKQQQPAREVSLTPRNVGRYLQVVRNDVVAERQEALEAVVEGFEDPALVGAGTLEVLRSCRCTWYELRHLLAGSPMLDRHRLVRLLKFREFDEDDDLDRRRQEWVKQAIRSDLTKDELASFLLFVTGNDAIPVVAPDNYLTIAHADSGPDHLPQAHTCFNTLDLPPYGSKDALLAKLRTAINSGQQYLNS
jgi:hypothetical protein